MTSIEPAAWRVLAISTAACLAVAFGCWWGVRTLQASAERYRARFVHAVSIQLGRFHLFIDPGRLLTLNVAAALGITLAAWLLTRSAGIAMGVAIATGFAPRWTLHVIRVRRRLRFREQMPDLLLLTAGGLRAGGSLWQALERASADLPNPARQEIELMLREQRLGVSFADSVSHLERRLPVEEMLLMAAALRIAHDTGGNLAESLETLAETCRRKLSLESKIRALTAQGRMQGWVMSLLPLLLGAVLFQLEPTAMARLFDTRLGLSVCAVVAVLQLLGLHFVRRIVAIDV